MTAGQSIDRLDLLRKAERHERTPEQTGQRNSYRELKPARRRPATAPVARPGSTGGAARYDCRAAMAGGPAASAGRRGVRSGDR